MTAGQRRFAEIIAADRREQDARPVEEAARLAWHPGGPPLAELERRIRADRAQRKTA